MPDYGDRDIPSWWDDAPQQFYSDFADQFRDYGLEHDARAQDLFHQGYFDMDTDSRSRMAAREELDDYLDRQYNIYFDEAFDYEAYREWYDSTQ